MPELIRVQKENKASFNLISLLFRRKSKVQYSGLVVSRQHY